MNMMMKRLFAWMLCLTLLLGMIPAAHAEGTVLEVSFTGLWAQADGQWKTESLAGRFTVYQGGALLGEIVTGDGENGVIALPNSGSVTLVPQMDAMPEHYMVHAGGYAIGVTEGRTNLAPLQVYADAGLFTVQARGAYAFVLTDADGAEVLSFSTDENGWYALPEAVPSGEYALHLQGSDAAPVAMTLEAYTGSQEQILQVQVDAEPVVTPETTAEPTAEPTAVPTEVPTAEPTAEPTEVPTEAPTAEPTAVPTEVPTAEPTAEPTAVPTEVPTAEPTAEPTAVPTAEPTAEPTPVVTRVPDASVAGKAVLMDGTAVAGAEVSLLDGSGNVVAVNLTDDAGAWSFTNLAEGHYVLRMAEQNGQVVADVHVTLEGGQQLSGVAMNFGKPGSIRIATFEDGNNNGKGGKYEKGVANVTVHAVLSGDASLTPVATGKTNKKGEVRLDNLAPGEYQLLVELPQGYGFGAHGEAGSLSASMMQESDMQSQLSAAFTLESEGEVLCGIGMMPLAVVSGYVWLDENADGKRQSGEPGQSGCTIELVLRGGDTMYQLVTGEDGNYVFGNVKPGEYNIRATTPDGLMFTKYSKTGGDKRSIFTADGVRKATKLVNLDSGDVIPEQNIGLIPQTVLQVQCFLDANYNGFMDEGEEPLAGVEAELIRQSNGKSVVTKESGEDGVITFDCLRANTYRLRALLPEGAAFTLVTEDPAGNQFKAREGRRENYVNDIVIENGVDQSMVVGGVWPSKVTGVCYLDDDFSATMNGEEKTVSGLTVYLLDASGNQVASDRTNAKGVYVFEGVNPGTYTISLSAKRGYAFTKLGEGNVIVNKGDGDGASEPFQVTLGSALSGLDVGMILPGTVQGEVFADANDNGVKDNGEKGLTGTIVRLMGEDGEFFAATIGEDGKFVFDAVMPGHYYVRYELPERGVFGQVVNGGNTISGQEQTGAGEWFDFKVGAKVNAPLCGALILGQADGLAFLDPNANGQVDAGEGMLSGVTLTLTPSRSDLETVSTVTGEDGSFLLTNLHPDTYTLSVTYPEGLVMSRVDDATLPVSAGQNSQSVQLQVKMGDAWHDQLLGGVEPAMLQACLWMDADMSGAWDESDPTPAGEVVEIIDQHTGSVFAVVTTDENGSFSLNGLIPGLYTLRYTLDSDTISASGKDTTFAEEDGVLVMRDLALRSGETTGGVKLGIVRYTNLGGSVWADNGGSIVPLANAEVTLADASGAEIASSVTSEDGLYAFGKLLPGQYVISVALPEGYVAVEPGDARLASGENVSIMRSCNGRNASSDVVEVVMGEDQVTLDIGAVLPGRLGDMAWLDLNGNGLQDTDEGGIPGLKVELLRDGQVVAETVTDQYGYYLFTELYPAAYTLRVALPDEVKPTRQRTDFPGIVSVLEEGDGQTAVSVPVNVSSDRSNYNADLGFVLRSKDKYPAGYGQGMTQDWTKITVD